MKELFGITKILENQQLNVTNLLKDALSETQIIGQMNQVNLPVTKDILQLYTSINGTETTKQQIGQQWFYPGFIFLSLENAIELYKEECLEYQSWDSRYFPIFWNGNTDYLLVNCMEENSKIFLFSMEPDAFSYADIISIYDSIDLMMKTLLVCFEKEVYRLSNEISEITIQHSEEVIISRKINPEAEYWKLF